jgi:hypothetical protein
MYGLRTFKEGPVPLLSIFSGPLRNAKVNDVSVKNVVDECYVIDPEPGRKVWFYVSLANFSVQSVLYAEVFMTTVTSDVLTTQDHKVLKKLMGEFVEQTGE